MQLGRRETEEGRRRLEGRTAIVTGSASGIGAASALLFAAEGAHVVGLDRDAGGNGRVIDQLHAAGGSGEALVLDLSDHAAVAATAAAIRTRHPRIDLLFNNAGLVVFQPAAEATDELWDEVVDANLRGAFMLTKELLSSLRAAPAGAVVNNASIDGLFGHPLAPVYSIAKAGMVAMTRSLAYELGADGIRVNCIASGGIATPMIDAVPEVVQEDAKRQIALRRLGEPEEVARVALFLASEEASYVTGTTLSVDGGRTAITAGVLGPPDAW
jgi:NAD(P)-dependent dehydrogenase (short-subunit alcohol dehydrogenase family)